MTPNFYICKHKTRCCAKCLKELREKVCELDNINIEVCRQRDTLKKEVEGLLGKTQFCLSCEGHAREAERLRGVLEAYAKDIRTTPDGPLVPNAAKQAISVAKDAGGS